MYRLNQIKLNINHSDEDLKKKIAKVTQVCVDDIDWSTFKILHKAIDARDKKNILFVYNVAFDLVKGTLRLLRGVTDLKEIKVINKLEKYEPVTFNPTIGKVKDTGIRPIVVGFGPAGIFASYILALNGLKPIIIERGKSLNERKKDVDKFFETLELDENSNVCFGEGGAGAFSDGKLNTNNKDKTGIYHFVLETFVKFGADEKILYEHMPHIGTDKLVDVIKNIRNEIIKLGGEIYYNTKMTFEEGQLKFGPTERAPQAFAPTTGSQCFAPMNITKGTPIILAIGNSSRDTFRELILNGFDIKAKPIAVGYRIAHKQSFINEAQYGASDILGPATYKLTYEVGNNHSVYSFCMCPGGYIINSSNYKNMLSVNGMSYNDRSGKYANSAIVETIQAEDVSCMDSQMISDPTIMIEFQERVEKAAFELEKGLIPYVTSDGRDVVSEEVFKGQAKYCEKLKSVYENCGLKFDINKDIERALGYFNRKIPGFFERAPQAFAHTEYVIAGVETRTSSPVKLDRDENYMCNVPNFYPCGEGLGHGGGIMSCAVDGINVAMAIARKYILGNLCCA